MFNRISPLMNAEGVPVVPGAPAPVPAPAPVAPPAPAPAPPVETFNNMSADAFRARLAEERVAGERAFLKSLGIDDPKAAKAAIDAAKAAELASMSELQKAQQKAADLEVKARQADASEAAIKKYLASEEAAIPADKKTLLELAPPESRPGERLEWIANAKSKGLFAGVTAAPAVPAAPPNPANTIAPPGPAAPKPAGTLTAYEQWQSIKQKDEYFAAQFRARNLAAIEATAPKK